MRQLILLIPALLILGCSDTKQEAETNGSQVPKLIAKASVEPAKESAETNNKPTAKIIFAQRCSSCHGSQAEKKAMNVSQVIAGWDKAQILKVFEGYQSGTYGGKMKSIMKTQVSLLDASEKEALADYIATLK